MKTVILSAIVLMGLGACKKKTVEVTPAPAPVYATIPAPSVTSYTGELSYTSAGGTIISEAAGTATISGSATNYTITFSNSVPSVSGLKFNGSNGNYATVTESGSVSGISVGASSLSVGFSKDGSTWGFTGTR